MVFENNVKNVATKNIFTTLKNWDSSSPIEILVCSLFSLSSAERLPQQELDKIVQIKNWLFEFEKKKPVRIKYLNDFCTDAELFRKKPEELYLITDRLISESRKVHFVIAFGKLSYVDLPVFLRTRTVHLIPLTSDSSCLEKMYDPFVLNDPNLTIFLSDCFLSCFYEILIQESR